MEVEDFSKYEVARILGARALQIAMNAPLLIKITEEDLESIKYDALKISEIELNSGILPISIKKPFPVKKEEKLKQTLKKESADDKDIEKLESKEEEEITKEGEIMKLANPEDEQEETEESSEGE